MERYPAGVVQKTDPGVLYKQAIDTALKLRSDGDHLGARSAYLEARTIAICMKDLEAALIADATAILEGKLALAKLRGKPESLEPITQNVSYIH